MLYDLPITGPLLGKFKNIALMTNSFESHQFCIFNENYVMVH